ncbi:glycosyltransferase family 2 protein [Namhaeicola litoreus]|uniref:Glycosyltransferase family 2 protein n=1 Tax=Namhaeicola litoreus TaxID=1052145 RepID=A0ABW3XZD4_9FLAO
MGKIKLSIIIVTFNSGRYLKDCLASIEQFCSFLPYEIWISDNNSTDNTIEIAKEFSNVLILQNKENLGFAKANNLAVNQAKGEYVLLLNHDTILLNSLKPAFELIENELNIGAVGIKMLNGEKSYIPSVGRYPKPWQFIKFSSFQEKREAFVTGNFKNPNVSLKVDWITGAFLLTRKEDYQKAGGLDEAYFMYVEDVDFCKRLTLMGKEILFLPSICFVHFVGFNKTREIMLLKGFEIYIEKYFTGVEFAIARTCLNINYAVKKWFKGLR